MPARSLLAGILLATAAAAFAQAPAAVADRAPTATERAAVAQALKTPRRCLRIRVATVERGWASARFRNPAESGRARCLPYAADGVAVFRRRDDVWRQRFAGSSWACPIPTVPEAVRRDLGMGCPEGGPSRPSRTPALHIPPGIAPGGPALRAAAGPLRHPVPAVAACPVSSRRPDRSR